MTICRYHTEKEIRILSGIYLERLATFKKDTIAAKKMLSVGASPRDTDLDLAEHAAWTEVARLLLNLDEVITRG